MICAHVISVQADMCAVHVKPRSGGRSQNYMAPEAKDALDKARKAQEMEQAGVANAAAATPASAPAVSSPTE